MSQLGVSESFFCNKCKIRSSVVDDAGNAKCPVCKGTRTDGFNQVDNDHLKCLKCGCVFKKQSSSSKASCPNGCN